MADEIKRDTVDYRDPTPFDNTKLNSLSDISKALRHKTYGEDTREAIAQQGEALAKLMQETGGNQSAEVAAARGKYETLGIREDAQDNALVQKVTRGENGQITWSMIAQDARDQIAGEKVAIVGPNSVANLNLATKAVSAAKTTFMHHGKNIFNKNSPDIILGKFANYANGVVGDNADYFMSGFFDKTTSGDLTINTAGKAVHLCFYDSNLNFISGMYKPETFSFPAQASFMRFSANIELLDLIQLELGSTSTFYENYTENFNMATKNDLINGSNLIIGHRGTNLFDKSDVTLNVFPYYQNGVLQDNDSYYASNFIPVNSNTDYFLQTATGGVHLSYYNGFKSYISGLTSTAAKGTNKTPADAKYVRFGANKTSLDELMFFAGETEKEYEKFGLTIDEDQLLPKTNARLTKLESNDISGQFKLLLPKIIYAVSGEQVSFYYYNILNKALAFQKGVYSIRFQKKNGNSYEKYGTGLDYMYYFTPEEDLTLTAKIFEENTNTELFSEDIQVKVLNNTTAAINVFWIGDSYSDGYGLVKNTEKIVKNRNPNVSFLGTRTSGTETTHHDAVGGARINNYFDAKIGDLTNPFYNTSSKTFDFSYYMKNNFTDKKANVFVIALGINDITRYATDDTINDSMDLIRKVIDSVHAYNPAIKILIRTINPQAQVNVRWENSYESNFMRAGRMKFMQEHWNEAVLTNFDSVENVYVMHDGASLDTRFGINQESVNPVKFMPNYSETVTKDTHPNDVGSKQLADVIGGYIV